MRVICDPAMAGRANIGIVEGENERFGRLCKGAGKLFWMDFLEDATVGSRRLPTAAVQKKLGKDRELRVVCDYALIQRPTIKKNAAQL